MSEAEIVAAVRGLTARYRRDGPLALHDVGFEVRGGERVALLGASGAGKSTLLRHLNGFMLAQPGVVEVLGVDPACCNARELRALRSRIGCVFQRIHLVGRLSVLTNVCSGALGRLRGPRLGASMYPRAVREEALACLQRVGLADVALRRADELSGGQQQRVAIARMLVQRPQLILADEPVAALDPHTSQTIMRLLTDVARERNLAIICSLHQVEVALAYGQRVIGLRHGRIDIETEVQHVGRDELRALYQAADSAGEDPARRTTPTVVAG